jgi:hypothetical protein
MGSLLQMSHGKGNTPLAVNTIPTLTADRRDGMIQIVIQELAPLHHHVSQPFIRCHFLCANHLCRHQSGAWLVEAIVLHGLLPTCNEVPIYSDLKKMDKSAQQITNRSSPWVHDIKLPNITVKWLTFLLRIWEVLGWSLSPETSYPDCGFPQSLQDLPVPAYRN